MKKNVAFLSLVILLSAIFISTTLGATTTLLSPIPGQEDAGKDLSSYLQAIFTYGIGLAALIALAQLIFGAVQYTTSAGAPSLQEDAKSRMRGAIIGLILLIISISILLLINRSFSVTDSFKLNPEVERALEEQERQRINAEENATSFKETVISETLAMHPAVRPGYLQNQSKKATDLQFFAQRYGSASLQAVIEYEKAFKGALLEIKKELSEEDFALATSMIDVEKWLNL